MSSTLCTAAVRVPKITRLTVVLKAGDDQATVDGPDVVTRRLPDAGQ